MKRLELAAHVAVEEFDGEGNLLGASQPQQIKLVACSPEAVRRALGALADQLIAATWPQAAASQELIGKPDCDDGSGRRGGSVKGGGHTDGG